MWLGQQTRMRLGQQTRITNMDVVRTKANTGVIRATNKQGCD